MGWLQTTYTVRFNRKYRRNGHLFQGRSKAQVVDAQEYGKWLVQYIHYNPVRPRDRRKPIDPERKEGWERYEWSSHRDDTGRRKAAAWLCMEWMRMGGKSRRAAQQAYRKEMASGFGKPVLNPWEEMKGGVCCWGRRICGSESGGW